MDIANLLDKFINLLKWEKVEEFPMFLNTKHGTSSARCINLLQTNNYNRVYRNSNKLLITIFQSVNSFLLFKRYMHQNRFKTFNLKRFQSCFLSNFI